jgi:hypothetical protein
MARLTGLLAEWSELAVADPSDAQAYADALLGACEALDDEALRSLPGTPEDAAFGLVRAEFADRVDGVYLPWEWLESLCNALRLPVAELEAGWDISDGEDVYFCPRELLADDPDSPDDKRAFVRLDEVRRWPST